MEERGKTRGAVEAEEGVIAGNLSPVKKTNGWRVICTSVASERVGVGLRGRNG